MSQVLQLESANFPLRRLSVSSLLHLRRARTMARRALASAAQLRELDGAWEKVSTELSAAVTFALSQRAKDPLAAIVDHLIRHLPAGSMAALRAENMRLRAQVQELTLEDKEAENASLRAQLERERAMRATDPNPASSATSELKKSLEQVGATGWNDKRIGHLLGALDVNGDGVVDRSELETACRQLGDVLAALAGQAEEAAAPPTLQATCSLTLTLTLTLT